MHPETNPQPKSVPLKKKITSRALMVLYAMIMLEGLLMATPFGLFLYSFYLPILELVRKSIWTAWLASFFLPHSVYATTSDFIEFIRWKGPTLLIIGLGGFFIFAAQVYTAKFRRKGMVNNWLYSKIRHPQYLFFILAGVGLLFVWPRMMMLVLFILMSVFYYYLARIEEKRMLAAYPQYAEYMQKTAMFIPGNPGGKLHHLLLGWLVPGKLRQLITIGLVSALLMACGLGSRHLTATHLSMVSLPERNMLAISIFVHPEDYIRNAVDQALADKRVNEIIKNQGRVGLTAHLMPQDYGMIGMFSTVENRALLDESFRNRSSLRGFMWGTESNHLKIVFSKIDKPGQPFVPVDEILDMSAKMTPVVVVDLDLDSGEVLHLYPTSTTNYGSVPQPIF